MPHCPAALQQSRSGQLWFTTAPQLVGNTGGCDGVIDGATLPLPLVDDVGCGAPDSESQLP